MRPNDQESRPKGVSATVWEFFVRERESLNAERKCSRITKLSNKIEPFLESYEHKNRADYFRRVETLLAFRPEAERHVVFLDPDTGVGGANPSDEHVCEEQIRSVWSAMREDDMLLIYQHNARIKREAWIKDRATKIAAAVGRSASEITTCSEADACFLSITK